MKKKSKNETIDAYLVFCLEKELLTSICPVQREKNIKLQIQNISSPSIATPFAISVAINLDKKWSNLMSL